MIRLPRSLNYEVSCFNTGNNFDKYTFYKVCLQSSRKSLRLDHIFFTDVKESLEFVNTECL